MKNDFLTKYEQDTLLGWHKSLNDNRGDRARLRRAEIPEDILITSAFFYFLEEMKPTGWQEKIPILSSAIIVGVLSHVKSNDENKSFAGQLATGKKKAPMSELRFQKLQKSKTIDDFYRNIIRAIRLLNGQVNIKSLTSDIIQWHREFEQLDSHLPANSLAVRWATDYFTALARIKS